MTSVISETNGLNNDLVSGPAAGGAPVVEEMVAGPYTFFSLQLNF